MNRLRFVIANAVKQSRRLKLDCFAALAKTRFMDDPAAFCLVSATVRVLISLHTFLL